MEIFFFGKSLRIKQSQIDCEKYTQIEAQKNTGKMNVLHDFIAKMILWTFIPYWYTLNVQLWSLLLNYLTRFREQTLLFEQMATPMISFYLYYCHNGTVERGHRVLFSLYFFYSFISYCRKDASKLQIERHAFALCAIGIAAVENDAT